MAIVRNNMHEGLYRTLYEGHITKYICKEDSHMNSKSIEIPNMDGKETIQMI